MSASFAAPRRNHGLRSRRRRVVFCKIANQMDGFLRRQSLIPDGPKIAWAPVVLLGISLAAALSDALRARSSVLDVDDTLRRLQIEDLLRDNDWFDRTLPFVVLEQPYESPWSRLVDAPYYLITRLLEIFMPAERALDIATLVWPPLMLFPLVWLIHGTVTALVQRALRPIEVVGILIFLMQAALEFAPGRIDHHNVQMLLSAMFLRGLTLGSDRLCGIVTASAAVLSLSVGLETVPLLVLGLAGMVVLAIAGNLAAAQRMKSAGITLAAFTPVLALVLIGPAGLQKVRCDEISAPWILGVMGAGLIMAIAPLGWTTAPPLSLARMGVRFAAVLVPALAVLAGLLALFPVCAGGPLHMIDPVSRSFWFENIPQEASGLTLVADPLRQSLGFMIALALSAAALAGIEAVSRMRSGDFHTVLVWLVILAGILLTLMVVRYVRISFLLAAFIVPLAYSALVAEGQSGPVAPKARRTRVAAAVAAGSAFILAGLSPLAGRPVDLKPSVYHFNVDDCAGEDFGALASLPPGRIMAPFGMQYTVIEAGGGHALAAISFHRSAPGIRRLGLAFTSTDPAVRREALTGVDYVVVCAAEHDAPLDDMPLFRDLTRTNPPAGFERVEPERVSRVRVYRVDTGKI